MKRLALTIFVSMVMPLQLWAGQGRADSLRAALAEHLADDTVRIQLLNDLAYARFHFAPAETDSLALISLALSEKLHFIPGMARAYYLRSIVKIVSADLPNAIRLARLSRDLYLRLGDEAGLATAYNTLGSAATMQSNYHDALEYHQQALRIREKLGLPSEAAKSYVNIGMVNFYNKNGAEALKYYQKALAIYLGEVPDSMLAAGVQNNIGVVYLDRDSLDIALDYFRKSLAIYERMGNLTGTSAIMRNVGHIQEKKKLYPEAEVYFRKAAQLTGLTGNLAESAAACNALGGLYIKMEMPDSARKYLGIALAQSRQLGARVTQLESLEHLARLSKLTGDYRQSVEYLEQAEKVRDTLNDLERSRQINELNIRYETEKKEADNALLRAREAAATQRNNWMMAFFCTVASLLLLVIALLLRSNKAQKRTNQTLTEQKKTLEAQKAEIQRQKEAVEELSREKDALVGIVAHDLRAPLTRLEGLVNLISSSGPLNEDQLSAAGMVNKVTREGSALIRDLLQVTAAEQVDAEINLSEFDLNGFLRDLMLGHQAHAEGKNIAMKLETAEESVRFVRTEREFLTRIVDNLIDNALKFSQPGGQVTVTAQLRPDEFSVTVKDQGPGISAEDQARMFRKFQKLSARPTGGEGSTGLGLSIIKALVDQLEGRIEVESEPGKGAAFTVILPDVWGEDPG